MESLRLMPRKEQSDDQNLKVNNDPLLETIKLDKL